MAEDGTAGDRRRKGGGENFEVGLHIHAGESETGFGAADLSPTNSLSPFINHRLARRSRITWGE